MYNILVINPGATSTKISYFSNHKEIVSGVIRHSLNELEKYTGIIDQLDFRYNVIMNYLKEEGINLSEVDAIASRGGILPPLLSGAYEINDEMIDYLTNRPRIEHASNLGALLADRIKSKCKINTRAFIYDPVSVDELDDISRISGLKGIERVSTSHALNSRAVAHEVANRIDKPYNSSNFIVAHLGGGNSLTLHRHGRMADVIPDDEGPFSTERTGGLPVIGVMDLCYRYPKKDVEIMRRKTGGLYSYLETNDARIVEERIKEGDKEAETVFLAMAYQISKGIGSLATCVMGQVDAIILTGGLAFSEFLMDEIKKRISFLAPIYIIPGEIEMKALFDGVYRVLVGEEEAHIYTEDSKK